MTTRTQSTGTQGQRGIVPQLQTQIQSLETQFREFEQRIWGQTGGGNGGATRQGTAGGVRARRKARATGGNAGGGGGTNQEWVANLLRQHGEGLTVGQIKAQAIKSGRNVYTNYPSDILSKMRQKGLVRANGGVFTLATTGGTGPVARSGTARTRVRSRASKAPARAMTAAG